MSKGADVDLAGRAERDGAGFQSKEQCQKLSLECLSLFGGSSAGEGCGGDGDEGLGLGVVGFYGAAVHVVDPAVDAELFGFDGVGYDGMGEEIVELG